MLINEIDNSVDCAHFIHCHTSCLVTQKIAVLFILQTHVFFKFDGYCSRLTFCSLITNIQTVDPSTMFVRFSDDTAILALLSDFASNHLYLPSVVCFSSWRCTNFLLLNVSKTKEMCIDLHIEFNLYFVTVFFLHIFRCDHELYMKYPFKDMNLIEIFNCLCIFLFLDLSIVLLFALCGIYQMQVPQLHNNDRSKRLYESVSCTQEQDTV